MNAPRAFARDVRGACAGFCQDLASALRDMAADFATPFKGRRA